jgi:c-di-GMP-related signal transduction protein
MRPLAFGGLPVMADHFLDHEADELLAELGIEVRITQAVGGRLAMRALLAPIARLPR